MENNNTVATLGNRTVAVVQNRGENTGARQSSRRRTGPTRISYSLQLQDNSPAQTLCEQLFAIILGASYLLLCIKYSLVSNTVNIIWYLFFGCLLLNGILFPTETINNSTPYIIRLLCYMYLIFDQIWQILYYHTAEIIAQTYVDIFMAFAGLVVAYVQLIAYVWAAWFCLTRTAYIVTLRNIRVVQNVDYTEQHLVQVHTRRPRPQRERVESESESEWKRRPQLRRKRRLTWIKR